jgi:hypothetical protein
MGTKKIESSAASCDQAFVTKELVRHFDRLILPFLQY